MSIWTSLMAVLGLAGSPQAAPPPVPPSTYLVQQTTIADEKAVFATIQSANVVPARARIGGTIVTLLVKQGDRVEKGQVIATVGDQKLSLQADSYSAQVRAAQAQLAQAKADYDRAQRLLESGALARSQFEAARTAYNVANSNVQSMGAQRSVVQQQEKEGAVLAPTAGRVITVPVTAGTVVMAGDYVATVAEGDFVLRLEVPERLASSLKTGDRIRVDGPRFGTIKLVYPQIDNGHVVADATVAELSDYFVGQRVRVWVAAGQRKTITLPPNLIVTRAGIDYVRLWTGNTGAILVPVERGQTIAAPGAPERIEILSGLKAGDRLLPP